MKDIILTEDKILSAFTGWLSACDADELARMTGETFGGECFSRLTTDENGKLMIVYDFTPNINYGGEFGGELPEDENIILEPVEKENTDA